MTAERWGLPRPSDRRIAIRVTRDAERRVKQGHPWLFDGSITSQSHAGAPGDLAVVFDGDRQFVAVGLYDPASPIRVRILHRGRPATIDGGWWAARLSDAFAKRATLEGEGTTAYRCVNGESDGFGGLVLDRYDDVYVLKIYSAAWFPHLPDVVREIDRLTHPRSLVLRTSRAVASGECFGLDAATALIGSLPDAPVPFTENGLRMQADVVHGQKTGHFLDQRDNRRLVRDIARDAKVLDMFACTGGFSVHAAAGGARTVHSVDMSAQALDTAVANMALNAHIPEVARCHHTTEVGDAFEVLRALAADKKRFDLVIVDPPSFAHKAADVDRARAAYRALTQLAIKVVRVDGCVVQSSCSSRISADDFMHIVLSAVSDAGADVDVERRTGHAIDHPIGFTEAEYLKTLVLRRVR
jgi:23S rRNA (cytosine1962-C5)-methyltransferase